MPLPSITFNSIVDLLNDIHDIVLTAFEYTFNSIVDLLKTLKPDDIDPDDSLSIL